MKLIRFLNNVSTILTCVGGHFVIAGASVGELIAFQMLAGFATSPILSLTSSIPSIINVSGSLKRLEDLSNTPSAREFLPRKEKCASQNGDHEEDFNKLARISGNILMEDVSLVYPGQESPVLNKISLEFSEGEQVLILGSENSGKSTLAQILAGMLAPSTGQILFDGREQINYDRALFRRSITLLDHEHYFFDGTVADNLTMWHKYLDEDHVRKIAEITGLHEVLLKRPESYRQSIKQVGHGFSYGEFELLSLTRILLLQPKVVVLDGIHYGLNQENIRKMLAYLHSSHIAVLVVSNTETHLEHFERIVYLDRAICFDGSKKSYHAWLSQHSTNNTKDKVA